MTLGQEFAEFVAELLQTDGDFGSAMVWRHVTRTEVAATGAVTEATSDDQFRGGVTDPVRVRLFGEDTLAQSSTAIGVPAGALTTAPTLIDRVSIDGGSTFRVVVEIRPVMGPGDAGAAVLVCYLVALGGIVEQEA